MAWLHNLLMLGKGPAPDGKLAFTTLSLSGTPGRSVTFTAKQAADGPSIYPNGVNSKWNGLSSVNWNGVA